MSEATYASVYRSSVEDPERFWLDLSLIQISEPTRL